MWLPFIRMCCPHHFQVRGIIPQKKAIFLAPAMTVSKLILTKTWTHMLQVALATIYIIGWLPIRAHWLNISKLSCVCHKVIWGSEGAAPYNLNLGTRRSWVVSCMPGSFNLISHWTVGGWPSWTGLYVSRRERSHAPARIWDMLQFINFTLANH